MLDRGGLSAIIGHDAERKVSGFSAALSLAGCWAYGTNSLGCGESDRDRIGSAAGQRARGALVMVLGVRDVRGLTVGIAKQDPSALRLSIPADKDSFLRGRVVR